MNNDQHNRRDDNRPAGQLIWSEPAPAVTGLVDAMIDIESLGTTPGSAILSIGVVMFGPAGLGETFHAPVLLQSCTAVGLTIDPNTIAWWMQQSDTARAAAFRDDAEALAVVLYRFSTWFTEVHAERPWCHGATFDVPVLEAAYKACGIVPPWKFWNVRDTRTLYELAGVKVDRNEGTHHNALDDALAQAGAAAKAMRILTARAAPTGIDLNWVNVKDRMPKLIPIGDPPHEFVACSARVLVCGWADKEFYWSVADLRRGGRGIEDRAVRWNTDADVFWNRDHLITHWAPLSKPGEASVTNGAVIVHKHAAVGWTETPRPAAANADDFLAALRTLGVTYDDEIPYNAGWFAAGSCMARATAAEAAQVALEMIEERYDTLQRDYDTVKCRVDRAYNDGLAEGTPAAAHAFTNDGREPDWAGYAAAEAAHADDKFAAEFLSRRLARVARAADVSMPEGSHEFIAGVAGTILGDIARKLESAPPAAPGKADAANTSAVATLLQAAGAMRMVRCHDGSGKPFAAYDKDIADRIVADLRAEMHALTDATSAADTKNAVQSQAARDVLAERRRQIEAEGYYREHDDEHVNEEIAAFAAYYAMPPGVREWPAAETGYADTFGEAIVPNGWTPSPPGDRRRELVKAGALVLAEIERLDRAAISHAASNGEKA